MDNYNDENESEPKESLIKKIFLKCSLFLTKIRELNIPLKKILIGYTILLVIVYAISFIIHCSFICHLLYILTGFSLLFIAYIICIVAFLDGIKIFHKPHKNIIILRWIFYITFILVALFATHKYTKKYDFDSRTFYVEKDKGVYHLFKNCNSIENPDELTTMKGYKINKHDYTVCITCEQLEDAYTGHRFKNR